MMGKQKQEDRAQALAACQPVPGSAIPGLSVPSNNPTPRPFVVRVDHSRILPCMLVTPFKVSISSRDGRREWLGETREFSILVTWTNYVAYIRRTG